MIEEIFICPVCGGKIKSENRTWKCSSGHCFDLSASGYVNLLRPGKMKNRTAGDDRGMVASRTGFLSAGYYEKNRDTLLSLIFEFMPAGKQGGVIIDDGCGEGYYTNAVAKMFPEAFVVGIDASKYACEAASKSAKRGGISNCTYSVASLSDQPIRDGSADVIISLFSPCDYNEFVRILKPGGKVIIGSAGRDHLYELKEILYGADNVRVNEPFLHEERAKGSGLVFESRRELKYETTVCGNSDVMSLFAMTPYYWRTPKSGAEALSNVEKLSVKVEVDYTVLTVKQ